MKRAIDGSSAWMTGVDKAARPAVGRLLDERDDASVGSELEQALARARPRKGVARERRDPARMGESAREVDVGDDVAVEEDERLGQEFAHRVERAGGSARAPPRGRRGRGAAARARRGKRSTSAAQMVDVQRDVGDAVRREVPELAAEERLACDRDERSSARVRQRREPVPAAAAARRTAFTRSVAKVSASPSPNWTAGPQPEARSAVGSSALRVARRGAAARSGARR